MGKLRVSRVRGRHSRSPTAPMYIAPAGSGTLSATLGDVTLASDGTNTDNGALASTLADVTLSSTATSIYNPANTSLTGWWRSAFVADNWTGTASAGSSGSRDLSAIALHKPTAGNALNGLNVANFDWATGQGFVQGSAISDLLSASAWSAVVLLRPTTVHSNNTGSIWQNDTLLADNALFWGLQLRSGGGSPKAIAYQWDGAQKYAEADISAATWSLICAKYDGTNIKVRVNSGSYSSSAAGNIATVTGSLLVGTDNAAAFIYPYDGRIAEIILTNSALSDTDMDGIKSYVNDRYALAL